jgi:hypothetical protein
LLLFSLFFGVAVLFFMIVDIVMLSDIKLIVSYLNSFLDDLSHVYQDIFSTCEFLLFIPTLVCMRRVNISSSNVCRWFIHGLKIAWMSDCKMTTKLAFEYLVPLLLSRQGCPVFTVGMAPKAHSIIIQLGLKLWPLNFFINDPDCGILSWWHLLMHVWWKIH